MDSDWRQQVQNDRRLVERLQELRTLTWTNLRKLARDKEFVKESLRLRRNLESAYKKDPEAVTYFFSHFAFATGLHLRKVSKFLRTVKSRKLRKLLRRYLGYATRFRCGMKMRRKGRQFGVVLLVPRPSKFHARIWKRHLKPVVPTGKEDPYEYAFEASNLELPSALEKLVNSGAAKVFQIDDRSSSSVLNEVENAAYHIDGLTYIIHQAERPYILCLIGEKADTQVWRDAAKAVHALQRKYFKREKAGKPSDVRQLFKVDAQMRKSGPMKVRALSVAKTENSGTSLSAFSNLKRQLS
jgi:hypothetical protein